MNQPWILAVLFLSLSLTMGAPRRVRGQSRRRQLEDPNLFVSHIHTLVHQGKAKKRKTCGKAGGKSGGKAKKASLVPTAAPTVSNAPSVSLEPTVYCTEQPTYVDEDGNVHYSDRPAEPADAVDQVETVDVDDGYGVQRVANLRPLRAPGNAPSMALTNFELRLSRAAEASVMAINPPREVPRIGTRSSLR